MGCRPEVADARADLATAIPHSGYARDDEETARVLKPGKLINDMKT